MKLFSMCVFLLLLFYSGFAETNREDETSLLDYLYGLYNSINPLYAEGNYSGILEILTPIGTKGTIESIGTGDIVYDNLPGKNDGLTEIQEVFLVLAWYKAMGYFFLEQYEEAQVFFNIVLDYYPYVDGRFFGYYAKSFRNRGKPEEAYSILKQGLSFLKEDKDKAIIYWYLSSFLYEDGDYSQTIEAGRKGYTYDYTLMGPVYYEFLAHLQLNNNKEALKRLLIIFYEYFYQNTREYLSDISTDLNILLKEKPDHRGINTALWFISVALDQTEADSMFQKIEKTLMTDDLLMYVPQPQGIHYYLLSLYYSKSGDHDKSQDYAHYCYATGAGLVNYDEIAREYYFQKDENNRLFWSGENYLFEKTRQMNTAKKEGVGSTDAELVLQLGHSHAVWGLDVNQTGNLVLSASLDNTIKLWRVDGRLLRTLKGHTDDVNKAVFIPGSTTIVSAGQDHSIRFWDMEGKCIRSITDAHPDKVDTIAVNNSGNRIVTTSMFYKPELSKDVTFDITSNNNVMIKIWSQKGELLHTKEIENIERVNDTVFSADGRYFYTAHGHFLFGRGDNLVRVWNSEGMLMSEFKGHFDTVNCVAVSPDGDVVVSGSKSGEIIIWNIKEKYSKTIGVSLDSINDVAFSPDNRLFATVSGKFTGGEGDETVKIWSRDGKLLNSMSGHSDSITQVAFDDEGRVIITGSKDGTVKFWSLDGSLIRTLEGNWNFLYACAWNPRGNLIATGSNENYLNLWETTGALYQSIIPGESYIGALDYNSDGSILASGSGDGKIRLWDSGTRLISEFQAHESGIVDLEISPDNTYILSSGFDSMVCLWDMKGNSIIKFPKFTSVIDAIGFTPDSKTVALGVNQEIVFYDLGGREVKRILYQDSIETLKRPFDTIRALACSPDGNYITATIDDPFGNGNHSVKVFALDGTLLHDFRGHTNGINRLLFSPDSRYVASGSLDTTVRLMNISTGKVKVLEGHHDKIEDLDFSPDGKFLVSTGYDATIRIWNVETGGSFGIVSRGDDWISFNEEGYFDASRGGGELINMVEGPDAYGIDQFSAFKNRPDIILKSVGFDDESIMEHYHIQYLKRLIKNNYIPSELSLLDFHTLRKKLNKNEMDFLESCYNGREEYYALSHELNFQEKLSLLHIPPYLEYVETLLDGGYHVPQARITNVKKGKTAVVLDFTCKDSLYDIISYNVFINDVPLFGTQGKSVPQKGNEITISETIELLQGQQKIEISCTNEKLVESFRDFVVLDSREQMKGDLYFIGFGVSTYKDESLNLLYPHKDVADLEHLFTSMEKDFKKIYTYTYTNEKCTVETIKRAKQFLEKAVAEDTVVLFISGHGLHDSDTEATYYYLTYETDLTRLSGSAAEFELLEDILDNIHPRKKLFLMDTCESGEIDDEYVSDYMASEDIKSVKPKGVLKLTIKESRPHKTGDRKNRSYLLNKNRFIYNDIYRRTGAIVFSSSRGGEYSYEPAFYSEQENGFFTSAIIKAFLHPETDTNKDGIISTDELKDFVIHNVSERSKGLQNPTVDRDNLYQKLYFPITGDGSK